MRNRLMELIQDAQRTNIAHGNTKFSEPVQINLNAEAIKRALEVCSKQYKDDSCYNYDECSNCIYHNLGSDCVLQAITDALALINSQEQKIKELAEEDANDDRKITANTPER